MAVTPLGQKTATPVIAATFAATAAPTGSDDGYKTGPTGRVRTFHRYAGAVTAANVRVWFKQGGVWYRGATTDDLDPLDPAGATVAEARDWSTGRNAEIRFQVVSITPGTSGNTIAVDAMGVSD